MKRRIFWIGLFLMLPLKSWSATYEASLPAYQGGSDAGIVVLVLNNRSSAAVPAQVTVKVADKLSGTFYAFPVMNVTVPARTTNSATGEISMVGQQIGHWDLKSTGFTSLKSVTLTIQVPDSAVPPNLTWNVIITGRQNAEVRAWADHRQFAKL